MKNKLTVQAIQDFLAETLGDSEEFIESLGVTARIRSFEDAGLLTSDKGLVIKLSDGIEIQLTIQAYKNRVELPSDAGEDE